MNNPTGDMPNCRQTCEISLECCGLGTGSYLVRDDLPPGTHRITLVTPDGQDGETSSSVWITVVEAPTKDKC